MYEQLDNDLKKRIEELFENVESPTAEEGWAKLLEKFPAKKKNRIAFIWFYRGAAALLFLVLGLGLFYYRTGYKTFADKIKKYSSEKLIVKNPGKSGKNNISVQPKTGSKINETKDLTASKSNTKNKRKSDSSVNSGDESLVTNNTLASKTGIHSHQHTQKYETSVKFTGIKEKKLPKKTKINNVFAEDEYLADNGKDNSIAELRSSEVLSTSNQKLSILIEPLAIPLKLLPITILEDKSEIYKMFAETRGNRVNEKVVDDKKLKFGIYEATYLNYAKGSESQVNLGLGVSSDIYINKKLKLTTGLALAKNSLSYSSSSTLNAAQNSFLANATTPAVYLTADGFNPATSVKNYSAGLLGLEVPINLKYDLSSGKNDLYIAAGFSSGTFISETYSYQYGFSAASFPYSQQTQGTSSSKNFDNFYFAKTLNLAFGAGLPFGKKRLVAEPFLKYPIGGLGTQNIQFGAGGLNLKFKF